MLKEECGIFGAIGDKEAANLVYLGLYALQHRGQEGCGIVSISTSDSGSTEGRFFEHKSFGLVADSFDRQSLNKLPGDAAIGHVRYSTHGGNTFQNIQPFTFRLPGIGPVAIAHNGNLTNAEILRRDLEKSGSIFSTTSDTEVIIHLLARSNRTDLLSKISDALAHIKGAYSLLIQTQDRIYGIRDPHGFRPLVVARREGCHVLASETCALDLIDATDFREVDPGEIVELSVNGLKSHSLGAKVTDHAFCAFEPIYFARPDSYVFGSEVYEMRKAMGSLLAEEAPPLDGEIVMAIPDSGVPMALGYAEQAGLPMELGLVRNHYVGRTFIEPSQEIRDFGVKLKLNPVINSLRGKNVVVIDDSIVRGTTSVKIIRMLRKSGVNKIHFRIGSPPITHSCYYGVDTPKREDLIAAQKNVEAMKSFLGADSLAFLSLPGLQKALSRGSKKSFCFGCFTGKYVEDVCAEIPKAPTDLDGPGLQAGI